MSVVTWPRPRLRLRHPAQPDRALAVLNECIQALDQLPGRGPSVRHDSSDYVMQRRDQYIEWVEDTDTRVKIAATVREDLRGLLRMWVNRPWKRAKAKAEQAP